MLVGLFGVHDQDVDIGIVEYLYKRGWVKPPQEVQFGYGLIK